MQRVYIMSEGERYEGEHVIAVYATRAAAMIDLNAIHQENLDAELRQEGDTAIVESGIFYTVVRTHEVV